MFWKVLKVAVQMPDNNSVIFFEIEAFQKETKRRTLIHLRKVLDGNFMQCNFQSKSCCLLSLCINSHVVCLLLVYLSLTGGSTAREGEQYGCLHVLHCVHYFWIFLCLKSFHRCHHRQLQSTQATGQQPYTFFVCTSIKPN